MQLSYWERSTYFETVDVAIIGSGIVGLSAAISLKSSSPKLKIVVLERGPLPSGASTKNAGFACFGSITEILDDLKISTKDEVFALVERRYRGLQFLRSSLGDDAIQYQPLGGFELINDPTVYSECADRIDEFNRLLAPITGVPKTYVDASPRISEFNFSGTTQLFCNQSEGQINTGKMMSALIQKAASIGIHLITGICIDRLSENSNSVELITDLGHVLTAKQLLVCTNGFAKQLLPELDVEPARAQVLITKPIDNLPFRGAFHYEKGYYYFRNVGNRVLFGGGRNLDFKGENTTEMTLTPLIQNKLDRLLKTVILPATPFEVDYRWSGIMGVGRNKIPIIKPLSERTFCAVRLGGMGIAIGSLVGEEAAQMVLKSLG